ncbi:unnamed protein product [Caenorhabditis angaria]|uniref:Serpentine receptor class r-10 n=1 Tax=Caenorhabditis angaria TaxID=860376 RepID=A0A9P1N5E6_9PELO|nr:unnamed protein product [Caenorhabditis angaria]
MSTLVNVKDGIQSISSIFSFFTNSLAIFLIFTKSPSKMGAYKYLMIYFALVSIVFSMFEFSVKPFMHTHQSCLIVFAKRLEGFSENTNLLILCAACGTVSVTISIFAIHFIFRYFAIERKGKLAYFQGFYLIFWIIVPLISGLIWLISIRVLLGPNETTSNFIRQKILETYGFDMSEIVYVAAFYGTQNDLKYNVIAGMVSLFLNLTFSIGIVLFCGFKIFRKVKLLDKIEGESKYTKRLQKQLARALVIQTLLPICLVIIPLATVFILPIFDIGLNGFTEIVNLSTAIYPAVDPLPTILIVDNYRKSLGNCLFFAVKSRKIQQIPE